MTNILSNLEYIIGIITLLGGVIAIHEFGHFIMAKWAGARVDVFSIGFGPKLFSKQWGETEYTLSLIPLGGYVKIYGQDPEELINDTNPQPDRSFANKSLIARIGVFIGGPAFNYFLAIFIFTAMIMIIGSPKMPPARATRIIFNSPAYQAGLRSGDEIKSINGMPTNNFEDISKIISDNPEKKISLQILRNTKEQEVQVQLDKEASYTAHGEPISIGVLNGLDVFGRKTFYASSDENLLGLKSGDEILSINGQKITIWEDIEVFFQSQLSTLPEILTFEIHRAGKKEIVTSQNLKKHFGNANSAIQVMDTLKLHNAELFVREVKPKAAAERAGLQPGDRIVGANKQKVYHFEGLRTLIQKAGEQNEKTVLLEVERAGKILQLNSELDLDKKKDPMGNTQTTYTIGIASMGEISIPLERVYNPAKALWLGAKETFHQTVTTVIGLKKLVMGEASMKSVGGPIMIAKIAGDAANRSWRQFFHIMAVISISLGVFNLLPVPILDGGHVVFAIIEAIRGKPVSQVATQWAMKVGMSLLLLLMVFAVYNDLSKVLPF